MAVPTGRSLERFRLSLFATALPAIALNHHHWLYAHTYATANVADLLVYRSLLVKPHDPIYQPIAELLKRFTPRLLARQVIPDKHMMFGHGELVLYRAKESVEPNPLEPIVDRVWQAIGDLSGQAASKRLTIENV